MYEIGVLLLWVRGQHFQHLRLFFPSGTQDLRGKLHFHHLSSAVSVSDDYADPRCIMNRHMYNRWNMTKVQYEYSMSEHTRLSVDLLAFHHFVLAILSLIYLLKCTIYESTCIYEYMELK